MDSATVNGLPVPSGLRVKVYIVGAGQVNGAYTGSAQDIGCFATYFPVK
jgi:hypothetical protein